ncbi:MAG: hypothetical protein ACRDRL_33095 [Sciscionella sp.]
MSRSKSRKRRKTPAAPPPPPPKRDFIRDVLLDVVRWPAGLYGRWALVVLVLIATWLVYMSGLTGGWLLDDYGNIVNNGDLVMHGLSWAHLWHAMWSFNAGPFGRPLSLMSFALERYFNGSFDPHTFKTVNLVLHLIAVVLLTGFTRALLLAWRRRLSPATSRLRVEWIALAVGAAWALHPMNLTPILYAVQRETILAALFTLAGLWLYVHLRERFTTTWPKLILLAAVVAVFTAIGALFKETGVLLPLFTLLLEVFVFRFRDSDERTARKIWWLYAVLLFLPAAIGLYDTLPGVLDGHAFVTREFNLPERVLTEGRVVIFYLGLILGPRLSAMALHHDDFAISTGLLSPATTLLSFLLIAALLVLAWWLRRRRPLIALGIVWFFAAQVLESTVFPLELVYEHRIYLADWGIILAVAALFLLYVRAPRLRTLVTVAAILAVIGLGLMTAIRAHTWRSNLALAHAEASHHPQSPRGTYLLARIETNKALGGERQYMQPAFADAQKATKVKNAGLDPWVAMILLAAQTGQAVPNAWFDGMVKAVGERPFTVSDVNALEALVGCYTRHQCRIQPGEIQRLFRAINQSPRMTKLGMNYANVLVTEANFIGYDTPATRAKSAPKLLMAANAVRGVAQFQVNVFNVALDDRDFALAKEMLARVEKLNKLGKLNLTLDGMKRRLASAEHTP